MLVSEPMCSEPSFRGTAVNKCPVRKITRVLHKFLSSQRWGRTESKAAPVERWGICFSLWGDQCPVRGAYLHETLVLPLSPKRITSQGRGQHTLGGSLSPIILFVRRRQTLRISTLRRAKPFSSPDRMGRPMARSKTMASEAGARRRKVNSEPISAGLFCRGVPVKHHRCCEDSAMHACQVIIKIQRGR